MFTYYATIDRIIDGDTVDVTFDLGFHIYIKERVRLQGINTPETRTKDLEEKEAGKAATKFLTEWVEKQEYKVTIQTEYDAKGKYGRVLGRLYNADQSECVNDLLLESGHAVIYGS